MKEEDGRTEELLDHLKTTIEAMPNKIDPRYKLEDERWMRMAPQTETSVVPSETQLCRGHQFNYHVPILIQVGRDHEVGTIDTEYQGEMRYVKANCLIDSGTSVSLVSK